MKRAVVETVAAVLGSFAVSVLVSWPLITELGDHIYGLGGDPTGGMAGFRLWADEVGYRITGATHVDSWGAPVGFDVGNGINVQSALPFFPAYVLTEVANEIIAYNFVVLSGLTLSGAAMYWLVRRLGCSPLVAGWAGLVFIVFPWHLEKAQGHPSLAHLEGFPLLMLALLAWHARPDLVRAALVAVAVAVLWTTSGYFGLIGLVALPVPFLVSALLQARRSGWMTALRRLAMPAAGALLVSGGVYVIASGGTASGIIAPARTLGELSVYGARWWEFFLPSPYNPYVGDEVDNWLAAHLHGSNFSEATLYVGWLTLVLAAGWLLWAFLRRAELSPAHAFATVALASAVVVGFLFSLPPPGPSRLVWEVSPQFRVPSRFLVLVMTGLVPLAALALERIRVELVQRVRTPRLTGLAAGAVCVVAGVLSFIELSVSPPATITDLGAPPAEYGAVERTQPGILAEYPLASSEQAVTSDYLFWRRAHHRPIVNGAPPGSFSNAVREMLVDPVTPYTARSLAALGVSAIVLRPSTYAFTGTTEPPPSNLAPGYRLRARTPSGNSVWEVTAAPAPVVAVFTDGFSLSETPKPRTTVRWMRGRGTVELLGFRPGTYRASFSVGSFKRLRILRIRGRSGLEFVAAPPLTRRASIVVRVPRGRSWLSIDSRPGAEALPDGRQATVYMSNWSFEPASPRDGDQPLEPRRR